MEQEKCLNEYIKCIDNVLVITGDRSSSKKKKNIKVDDDEYDLNCYAKCSLGVKYCINKIKQI